MRPLRPLLPSASRPHNEPLPPQPRERVTSACDHCRARKIKCGGERPVCDQCVKCSTSCFYATRSTETQGQAKKRKYEALQAENEAYAELFQLVKTSSASESHELLRRVKTSTDVDDVLKGIREANSLVQLHPSQPETRLPYRLPSLASIIPENPTCMPDNSYFVVPAPRWTSSDHANGSLLGSSAAQYPSPPE